jgi:uncharacterized membrane protein YphA (DoxX/SURF4 family)
MAPRTCHAAGTGRPSSWRKKLFGLVGGYGLEGTGDYMEGFGLRPGKLFAAMAGGSELTGGLLLATGLATPLAAAFIAATMFVAARTDHAARDCGSSTVEPSTC